MGVTRKVLNWYARLGPAYGKSKTPYEHVVQIGDPVLRKISEPVPVDKIKTSEIQTVIKKLEYVIKSYGSLGMSAVQIGVNLRIIAMRHTAKQIASIPKEIVQQCAMEPIPFTVFINPKLKIVDYRKIVHREGCESVQGYTAHVSRYRAVEITGQNELGEDVTKQFTNWAARVAQHEMDHLNGIIYTDIMDKKSLECTCWEQVNLSKGKLVIPFYPE